MNKSPLISIITVVYNRRTTLPLTLASVFGQTYPHVEYIIIDGASTDGTVEYLEQYRSQLGYFASAPDAGLYDAMNKGLDRATGDFCLFLNAGDAFYTPDSLAELVAEITDPDVYYYGTAVMTDGKHIYRLNPMARPVGPLFPARGLPNHQASLFPRAFYQNNRYDLSFRIAADDDYKIRALRAYPNQHIPSLTVIFELGGLSRDLSRFRSVRQRWQDAWALHHKHFPGNRARAWRTAKFLLKSFGLFALQKVTGFHWKYEWYFNKFQRIPAGEEGRYRSYFAG